MLKCDLSRLKPAAKLKSRLLMGSRWLTELNPKKVAAFKVSSRLAIYEVLWHLQYVRFAMDVIWCYGVLGSYEIQGLKVPVLLMLALTRYI